MQASKTGPESKKGWRKKIAFWFGGLVPPVISRRFLIIVRLIEFFAVILAVVAFFYDFYVERPRDRAVRNAQLIAQIADLSKGVEAEKVSPAIKNIMEFLANENVPMHGIALPGMELEMAQLSGADLRGADLSGAKFIKADISGANLRGADLSGTKFIKTDVSGVNLIWADLSKAYLSEADISGVNLTNANLEGVKGMGQEELDRVKPTVPAYNLPRHLSWPFKENDDGAWAPINEQVSANMASEIRLAP